MVDRFPDAALSVAVELQLGGEWVDITPHVYSRDPITITRGRPDEGARVAPSRCTLTINNSTGRYSPRNPLSPYYGRLGRNTPLRVSAGTGEVSLRIAGADDAYASTPDAAPLDITGDLDLRIEAGISWRGDAAGLIGKYVESGNQRSYLLWLLPSGRLQLYWSTDGGNLFSADSTVPVPDVRRQAVRVTLDVDNGAGGRTVTFWTAPGIGGPWSQLGAPVVQAGTTSVYAGTAPLRIGGVLDPVEGRVYAAEVRAGIGGAVVAAPVFTAQAEGATAFTDAAGRAWTLAGDAALTGRTVRFYGEVPSWPVAWDPAGNVWTRIEAAGITRRLGQGSKPLASALYRSIARAAPYTAWWPLEDSPEATSGAPGYLRNAPLRLAGDAKFTGEPVGGSAGGLTASRTGRAFGVCASPAEWAVACWLDVPADIADEVSPVLQWRTPGAPKTVAWSLYVEGAVGRVTLEGADSDKVVTIAQQGTRDIRGAGPVLLVAVGFALGSALHVSVSVDTKYEIDGDVFGDAPASVTTVGINMTTTAATAGTVSHLLVTGADRQGDIFQHQPAGVGYAGETAGGRLLRLCDEEGIPFVLPAFASDTEPMGPQRPRELLTLLDECADADGGVLFEQRDALGLTYRPRHLDYNTAAALTLDYHGQVAAPLEPVDDDQATRNDVTVTREGGSSARAVVDAGPLSTQAPPNGVGVYDEQITLNVASDDQLLGHAAWRAHLGTVDEARWPVVRLKLHKHPDLIDPATAADLRSRLHITGLPVWAATGLVDLLADGYTETIEPLRWTIEYNTVPGSPWVVGITDDPVLGRIDTDGSVLDQAAAADDTALPVVATAGPDWTARPAAYPFELQLGGEVVTATAASVRAADTFTRTAANGWGAADTGQAWTVAAGAAGDFSAAAGTGGVIRSGTVGVERGIVMPLGSRDQSVFVHSNTPVIPAGAPITWGMLLRYADPSNYYWLGVQINPGGTLTLVARKRVAGVLSTIATAPSATAHSTSVWRVLRAQAIGAKLRAKVWDSLQPEPPGWELETSDASLTAGTSAGCAVRLEAGNTNTLPLSVGHDLFTAAQVLTVTRAVNGVAKGQAAGTDVRLANPCTVSF